MTADPVQKAGTVPSELLGSVPRDVRLTFAGIALAVVGIAFVVGAFATAIGMSVAWLAGVRPSVLPIVLIPLVVLALLASGGVIARSVRRQWLLLSEGRVALARVTAFKKVSRDTGRAYKVSYEFQTLSGARHTSRCEMGKAPPLGAVIPIVYHRDQPAWSAIYPLQLVRPARGRS